MPETQVDPMVADLPLEFCRCADPLVGALLRDHPKVESVEVGGDAAVEFVRQGLRRRLLVDEPRAPTKGLVELMDNNPLVCAAEASVPGPAATLALIALGPLAEAGILQESPAILSTLPRPESLDAFLETVSWNEGVHYRHEEIDLKAGSSTVVIAKIDPRVANLELDELFEERFGRSFFVRRDEEGPWDVEKVAGTPMALYRLRITEAEGISLLTVQVMADLRGKCGAAQVVHALNVMAGFEETLGIPSLLP